MGDVFHDSCIHLKQHRIPQIKKNVNAKLFFPCFPPQFALKIWDPNLQLLLLAPSKMSMSYHAEVELEPENVASIGELPAPDKDAKGKEDDGKAGRVIVLRRKDRFAARVQEF